MSRDKNLSRRKHVQKFLKKNQWWGDGEGVVSVGKVLGVWVVVSRFRAGLRVFVRCLSVGVSQSIREGAKKDILAAFPNSWGLGSDFGNGSGGDFRTFRGF